MPKQYTGTSLLGSTTRVETPFIKVTFGDLNSGYTFGVYHLAAGRTLDNIFYQKAKINYPNYIQSLRIEKINGQVNQYSLQIDYPIRPGDDPNFFEKVFSSIQRTRKMIVSYGDISMPTYIYRNEETIITKIRTTFNVEASKISYSVDAISSAALSLSGNYNFPKTSGKPSDIIASLIHNPYYGLSTLFYGMQDMSAVQMRALGLLPGDDAVVELEAQTNMSILDYVKYLVSCMVPNGTSFNIRSAPFYILTIHDDVTSATLPDSQVEAIGGPYFKISKVDKNIQYSDAYEITIGAPSKDIVLAFSLLDDENYSIYYDWHGRLSSPTESYVPRINDNGEWEREYAPVISSGNNDFKTRSSDLTWWSKVTQFPITASITIKGLLRPATLMEYVKLNVVFFGVKHISSGMYIVTKQVDTINASGYRTTLSLLRVEGEEETEYAA